MRRPWAASRAWIAARRAIVLFGMLALFASGASAQSAQETALARALFAEGVELADRGDWQNAADRFARAYAIKPTSGIAFNYGSALVELKKLVEASELLQSVTRDPNASESLRRQSEQKLAEITPRIAYVTVRVEGEVDAEARVDIDGAELPKVAWGVASPIDPGSHEVRLVSQGTELAREGLAIGEGERREITLHSTAAAPPASAPPAQVAPDAQTQREDRDAQDRGPKKRFYKHWAFWTCVSAVVIGGVVSGVLLASRKGGGTEEPVMGNSSPGVISWP